MSLQKEKRWRRYLEKSRSEVRVYINLGYIINELHSFNERLVKSLGLILVFLLALIVLNVSRIQSFLTTGSIILIIWF
jgi:hypothetical protein